MKQSTVIAIGSLVLFASAFLAQAQTAVRRDGAGPGGLNSLNPEAEKLPPLLEQLTAEVRNLRLELLEQRLEDQELKMAQLARELEQVQTDQVRLEEQDRAFNQQIAELDEQLSQSTMVGEDRAELEAVRADLAGNGLERLRRERQAAARREAKVMERLQREQQRWQELMERAKALEAAAGN